MTIEFTNDMLVPSEFINRYVRHNVLDRSINPTDRLTSSVYVHPKIKDLLANGGITIGEMVMLTNHYHGLRDDEEKVQKGLRIIQAWLHEHAKENDLIEDVNEVIGEFNNVVPSRFGIEPIKHQYKVKIKAKAEVEFEVEIEVYATSEEDACDEAADEFHNGDNYEDEIIEAVRGGWGVEIDIEYSDAHKI